jgi:hypothetical protein
MSINMKKICKCKILASNCNMQNIHSQLCWWIASKSNLQLLWWQYSVVLQAQPLARLGLAGPLPITTHVPVHRHWQLVNVKSGHCHRDWLQARSSGTLYFMVSYSMISQFTDNTYDIIFFEIQVWVSMITLTFDHDVLENVYEIIPRPSMISCMMDISGICIWFCTQDHMQYHAWYHDPCSMISCQYIWDRWVMISYANDITHNIIWNLQW